MVSSLGRSSDSPQSSTDQPRSVPSSNPYARRREQFLRALGGRAAAVLGGHTEVLRNSDVNHRFRASSDLLYLTGFAEPEAVAVFTPGQPRKFTLFVRERDPGREAWYGPRAGVEGAVARHGADQAFPVTELLRRLPELLGGCDEVLIDLGENPKLDERVLKAVVQLRRGERRGARAPRRITELQTVLHEQRLIKDADALSCLRRAAEITVEAHRLAMQAATAGRHEYEIEALVNHTFRRHGGHPGYGTIVGAGSHATILHWEDNSGPLQPGELLLLDAGCEFHHFTADVTRTYPIAPGPGQPARFSPAQRRLYEVVLLAQKAGIAAARPGSSIDEIHKQCVRVATEGLVDLGLLTGDPAELIEKKAYQKYYLHLTSHWLGMDVHDVGDYSAAGQPRPLQPDMVLTIEPGLYVADHPEQPEAYRGIGVRIEDDILITPDGCEVLTRALPKEPAELESLVGT